MEIWLAAVDKFLQLQVVRWTLLAAVAVLLVTQVVLFLRYRMTVLQLSAARGDVASYAAYLSVQNDAIRKAGAEYEQAQKKALVAQEEADALKKQLQAKGKIQVAPAPCDEMVRQAIREIRQ